MWGALGRAVLENFKIVIKPTASPSAFYRHHVPSIETMSIRRYSSLRKICCCYKSLTIAEVPVGRQNNLCFGGDRLTTKKNLYESFKLARYYSSINCTCIVHVTSKNTHLYSQPLVQVATLSKVSSHQFETIALWALRVVCRLQPLGTSHSCF